MCRAEGERLGLEVECRQSNSEGQLVQWIQEMRGRFAGLILKCRCLFSHLDRAAGRNVLLRTPLIEVHLSNIYQRETFRQHSDVSLAATGVICGFGPHGYLMALSALAALLNDAS